MYKTPAEIALMQKANDLTLIAYRATWATMRDEMTQAEFSNNCATAFRNLGVTGGVFCSFGKYTAFPHGSSTPQTLQEGDVVLMDGGCTVEGYASDITRTFVLGKPTQRQRDIWNLGTKSSGRWFCGRKVGAL
jgi:Xaa-Pro dipeptidase